MILLRICLPYRQPRRKINAYVATNNKTTPHDHWPRRSSSIVFPYRQRDIRRMEAKPDAIIK